MAEIVPVDDPSDERVWEYTNLADPDVRRLREQPTAGDDGFFIAEGVLVIRQLLASPYRLRSVLVSPGGLRALEPDLDEVDVPVYLSSQATLEAVAGFHFHRGALASAHREPLPEAGTLAGQGAGLLVLVEGVNDHENLGALFRNAAAFGAGAVLLDPTCADPLYRRSIRVSMGQVLRMRFARMTDWPASIGALQALGYEVLALTPSPGAEDIDVVGREPKQALLVGAEGGGLSKRALAAADRRVRIPMAPGVDSLNVATAAAIALHHLARPG
ncbi:MAG: TrmH family RNA methyltransferase [Acidimicrobiales bacterium]